MTKNIGIIGGGQLAWMMAQTAPSLDIKLIIQTPNATDPAVNLVADVIYAKVDDTQATALLAEKCDVITFENEFVDLDALNNLAATGTIFYPPLTSIAPLLDKYIQRQYLQDLNLPVPKFTAIDRHQPLTNFTFPAVVKARRHGYDGQGTFIIKNKNALQDLLGSLGDTQLLIEEFIPFERELAVIAARSINGEIIIYPIVETQQEDQVCRRVFTLPNISPAIESQINHITRTLLESLQAVGVFGIELFLTNDERVIVNEIAPRTHNSGHFTIDACITSQFNQHLRAVSGLPLGKVDLTCGGAVMINLLGYETAYDDYKAIREKISALPNTYLHWYGKNEARIGRKLGHVTVCLENYNRETASAYAAKIEDIWYKRSSV